MIRKVDFYKHSDGRCPVEEFLDALPTKVAKKVLWVLSLIEDMEWVPTKYFCKLTDTDDVWECRIKLGSNIYRVFAFWDANTVVLTHGFIKKSQHTPTNEIKRAESYKKDYNVRKGSA